jgi:S1-C subfamily serine protease
MAKNSAWQPPVGRIRPAHKSFTEIVRDLRYCVFSAIRFRPDTASGQQGRFNQLGAGSGFFVGPNTFVTCNHLVNPADNPHVDGDCCMLVQNLGANKAKHSPPWALTAGTNLHLFPECDLAIIQIPGDPQPYATVGYNDILEGTEIGVAGYPLSKIIPGPNGEPQFPGVIYRIARGVVTSTATQWLEPKPNPRTRPLNTIEVNFMFVPGNSGGPIFDAQTGRVVAFVHGFSSPEIVQNFVDTNAKNIAAGAPNKHIQSLHAIYSIGIKLDSVRAELERFGVVLP